MNTDDQATAGYGEERSPWSSPSVLLSGMFILALLLAGTAVMILKSGSHTPSQAHAAATARAPQVQVRAPAAIGGSSTSACTLAAGNQTIPYSSPPAATQWGQVGSMSAPQAPTTLGPQHTSGVWNMCFAHSPSGALLAALNLWAEGTAAAPSEVFRRLAVGAPASLGNNDQLDSQGPVQFAGYKYQSYDPTTAQLLVVLEGPEGKLAAAATTMRWVNGDWKYVFPPGGQLSIEAISGLAGYVQWSAF